MRLAQAILFVDDVSRALAFYQGLLGLRVLHQEPGWIRLDAGGCVLGLHALRRADGTPLPGPPRAREDSHHKLCFHAEDVESERARLVAAGVTMREVHRHGDATFCDGVDPEGNVFQITSR